MDGKRKQAVINKSLRAKLAHRSDLIAENGLGKYLKDSEAVIGIDRDTTQLENTLKTFETQSERI